MGDKINTIYQLSRSKGYDYIGLYFFSRKAFLPLDPILIKNILGKDFQHFSDRGMLSNVRKSLYFDTFIQQEFITTKKTTH